MSRLEMGYRVPLVVGVLVGVLGVGCINRGEIGHYVPMDNVRHEQPTSSLRVRYLGSYTMGVYDPRTERLVPSTKVRQDQYTTRFDSVFIEDLRAARMFDESWESASSTATRSSCSLSS